MAGSKMLQSIAAVLVALAGLAALADAARQVDSATMKTAPAAPIFPASYEVEYTFTLPYVMTVQSVGLSYPVHIWYDGPTGRFRMDVYGGLDSSGNDGKRVFSLYPRITELVCDSSNATSGPVVGRGLGAWLGLGDGESSTPLPNLSSWSFAGTAKLGNAEANVWQLTEKHYEKTATYLFYTAKNGWPLKFHQMGVNMLSGSHFDEYIVEFTRFRPGTPADKLLAAPAVCQTAQAAQRGERAQGHPSLSSQLALLLPGVLVGNAASASRAPSALSFLASSAASTFQANAAFVDTHNALASAKSAIQGLLRRTPKDPADSTAYRLALNQFAHLTHEQWAATHLGLDRGSAAVPNGEGESKGGEAAARLRKAGKAHLGAYQRTLTNDELPPAVDWRGTGADGPVKDQANCGSCWAFSAVGAMQAAWFKATGSPLGFSEQQLVDCSWDYENNGCGGGNVEPAIQYVVDLGGLITEQDYPYLGQNSFCRGPGISNVKVAGPPLGRFKGYLSVPPRDEAALMEAVALHGPVAVVLNAARPPFKFYSEGVYHNEECRQDPDGMDHAVLLVGYGTTPEGVDYWLIKNSWSKLWGMDGYARITRKGNDCGITTDAVVAVVDTPAEA